MATCFQLYKKSTLPSLLDSYLPAHDRNQNGPNQPEIPTASKECQKNNKQGLSDENKEEIRKKALQEQHYLETYENLYRLRDILYERYRILLNEKVQKQRIQLKMCNLRVQEHKKHNEKKIIGLQNELTKLGILKNQDDYENFWKLAQEGVHSSKLKEKLVDMKEKMLAIKTLPASSAKANPSQSLTGPINSSSQKKSSASPLQSAGTCRLSAGHTSKKMKTQQENMQWFPKMMHSCASAGINLEEAFPPVRERKNVSLKMLLLPWLSEVQKKQGDQSRTQQVTKACKRNRKYEHHLHCLRRMYYFSLANMASSKRLLEQNGQFSDVGQGQSVHDLLVYLFPNGHDQSGINGNKELAKENACPSLASRKQHERHRGNSSKILQVSKEKRKLSKPHSKGEDSETTKDDNFTTFAQRETIAMPLTLEDVAIYNPIMEAKPTGTY